MEHLLTFAWLEIPSIIAASAAAVIHDNSVKNFRFAPSRPYLEGVKYLGKGVKSFFVPAN